jgi:hypothetical protein
VRRLGEFHAGVNGVGGMSAWVDGRIGTVLRRIVDDLRDFDELILALSSWPLPRDSSGISSSSSFIGSGEDERSA